MTLYRQLSLFIFIILVAIFLGTCTITINNSREYLVNQLRTHAEDTATMLGLSASSSIADRGTLETLVNSVFDSGDYRLIRIADMEQNTMVERTLPITIDNVPEWFVNLLALPAPSGTSLIMNGWENVGKVTIASHPGYAYQEAWQNVAQTLIWFLIIAIGLMLIAFAFLRTILQPLRAVEQQAQSIGMRDFTVQTKLPKTRELRRVVMVMNQLSVNVQKMFEEQSELTESYRKQLFSDPLTELPNRRYFLRQLDHLLETREKFDSGVLILVAVDHLSQINQKFGYSCGDQVLKKTAEVLERCLSAIPDAIVAHTTGSEFAILVPGAGAEDADKIASLICDQSVELQALGVDESLVTTSIGVALYQPGLKASEFLSQADHALRRAQHEGGGRWYRSPQELSDSTPLKSGFGYWRQKINDILITGQIVLHYQPVVGTDLENLHYEVLCRVEEADNRLIPAGVFMPMAERLGLSADLDRLIISSWLQELNRSDTNERFAINLSVGALRDAEFGKWLDQTIESNPALHSRLVIELSEHAVLCQTEAVRNLTERLAAYQCGIGVDHFGRGFRSFGYLSSLKVNYIKIDGGFIHGISGNVEDRFFVGALVRMAHELEIPVIAEHVENAADQSTLGDLRVDGYQGYFIGKPAPRN